MKYVYYIAIVLIFSIEVSGNDGIDQWRGPGRDGHYPEDNLLKIWPEKGPALLWSYKYSELDPDLFHPEAPLINCKSPATLRNWIIRIPFP